MSLLEEMKLKQEQRDRRRNLKEEIELCKRDIYRVSKLRTELAAVETFLAQTDGIQSLQPVAVQAPPEDFETTNLYVGSLSPDWTEEMISREFGRHGEIVSIKIMYPRTEAQRLRGMNSGFVQFRTRHQAELAKSKMNGKMYFGMALRIDWGRAVHPMSAQPQVEPHVPHPERKSRWNKAKSIVVTFPPKNLRKLIDKTAEFVAHEGWEFEKCLMDEDCPRFAFMRACEEPLHIYYRWRVFSYAQGDTDELWRTEPFQIYENGPLWQSPPCHVSQRQRAPPPPVGIGGADLTTEDARVFAELLTNLTLSRQSVLKAMAFCLDHSLASQAISHRLCASIMQGDASQLVARLCLLSDVLHNSHCTRPGASIYRRQFQEFLPEIFERLREICEGVPAVDLRERVLKLLGAWSEWSSFPPMIVKGLEATLCAERLTEVPTHWAEADVNVLERACRQRGCMSRGSRQQLLERLCAFESYWHDKAPAPLPEDEVRIDPDLDGEPLSEGDIEAEYGVEDADADRVDGGLLGDPPPVPEAARDLGTSGAEAIWENDASHISESACESDAQDGAAHTVEPETACTSPADPAQKEPETPDPEDRRRCRLRQVEAEVMSYRSSLDMRERSEVVAMRCDRKRMELLEAAAQQEAMLDMRRVHRDPVKGERRTPSEITSEPPIRLASSSCSRSRSSRRGNGVPEERELPREVERLQVKRGQKERERLRESERYKERERPRRKEAEKEKEKERERDKDREKEKDRRSPSKRSRSRERKDKRDRKRQSRSKERRSHSRRKR